MEEYSYLKKPVAYLQHLIHDPTPPTSIYPGPNLWERGPGEETISQLASIFPASIKPQSQGPLPRPFTPEERQIANESMELWKSERLPLLPADVHKRLEMIDPSWLVSK
ncbi:hypothetical protein FRC09_006232 [Ceratobasidium sp. 395]|nr:hypothetical protein FRC09_006232 [Ceratobasidium sp. 395]